MTIATLGRAARRVVLPMVVLVLATAAAARAHEIGTTRVLVLVEADGRYRIEIVTDATALVEKLEAVNGRAAGGDISAAHAAARLPALDATFRRRLTIAFDGVNAWPDIHYAVAPATTTTGLTATVALTGTMPRGARALTWTYGWTFASYALSVRHAGAPDLVTEWLDGGQASRPIALSAPPRRTVETLARYIALGFTHIVPHGLDHMLFVLGLFLLTRRPRPLLLQVSAFTIAHSITLGLGLYHLIVVPPAIVEPLIAVSIAYVAIENVFVADLRAWRVALVFAFGLLHGMGFAGALGELGLPRADFLTALVGFNVGVEAGQLTVIAAAFALVGWRWGRSPWYRRVVVVPASLAIATVAIYWTIARIVTIG